jgi:hypothetical protein
LDTGHDRQGQISLPVLLRERADHGPHAARVAVSPVPSGIVTVKNRTLSPTAQLFIDCTREVAKPFAKKKQ